MNGYSRRIASVLLEVPFLIVKLAASTYDLSHEWMPRNRKRG